MGRESSVRKARVCWVCNKRFLQMTSEQITTHAFACAFEQRTGIEIIRLGPAEISEEPAIILP